MATELDAELLRVTEVRKFDFLYEAKQAELRRICSIATTLLGADVAQVVMVDADHIKVLETDGPPLPPSPRGNFMSEQTVEAGCYLEVEDIPERADGDGPRARGLHHYAGAPLQPTFGLIVGVLAIHSKRVRRLSDKERQNLIALAQVVEDEMRLFLVSQELRERDVALSAPKPAGSSPAWFWLPRWTFRPPASARRRSTRS